jgi:putative chitinase
MNRTQLLAALPCGPRAADLWIGPVSSACHEWEINTGPRVAAFLAQIGHESGCFVYVRELWGPTSAQAGYEGRKDLGNVQKGDGKKFLGRGLIQITGRDNYAACSLALFDDLRLLEKPELLEDPTNAARSAGWFWKTHGLNELADAGNFLRITKIINGGTNGLEKRQKLYARALSVFASPSTARG